MLIKSYSLEYGRMIDVDFKTCCEDFEVEFTVGSLREDAGISEASVDE